MSLETEGEWNEVRRRMESWKAPFIWTSGHICDKWVETHFLWDTFWIASFSEARWIYSHIYVFLRSVGEACFTTESLQPRLINAWFETKLFGKSGLLELNQGFYQWWLWWQVLKHTVKSSERELKLRFSVNNCRFWSGSGSRLGATDRPQPGWRSNPWGWIFLFSS